MTETKSRRSFLDSSLSLTTAAILTPSFTLAQASSCDSVRLPGAQLFTVRNTLENDPAETLARLSEIGVREVEVYGLTSNDSLFGLPMEALKVLLDKNGLVASCAHMDATEQDTAGIARNANILGVETIILPIGPDFLQFTEAGLRIQGPQTLGELEQFAEMMNRLGKAFTEHELDFAYHNHHVEFLDVQGQIPFDFIMAYTDPILVKLEMDVGWMALANANYLDYLDSYGSRVVSVHLKDFNGNRPADMGDFFDAASNLVSPGAGVMDFGGVLDRLDALDISHGFVEIDSAPEPFSAIESGLNYLKSIHSCP